MRMEQVLDLRHRADRLDQQAFEYGDDTLDSIHTRQHLRHQAAQLRRQADNEAAVADTQASSEFQHIAAMVPLTLTPGTTELPKHWRDYYARHPELLEPEKGAADWKPTRKDLMAMLVEYHKQQESSWLPDDTRQEAAETFCKTAYSTLTEAELQSEIARILEAEAEATHWQEQIQAGVYGRELIAQPGYLAYAYREYYKNEGPAGGMHGILINSGKMDLQNDSPMRKPLINEHVPTLKSNAEIARDLNTRSSEIRNEHGIPPKGTPGAGNIGVAYAQIDGVIQTEFKAFSQFDNQPGFSPLREDRQFETKKVDRYGRVDSKNAYNRIYDTESKILEDVAARLGDNSKATGRIDLFTELPVCKSCEGVIQQFKEKYPNINIHVYDGKSID